MVYLRLRTGSMIRSDVLRDAGHLLPLRAARAEQSSRFRQAETK